MADHVLVAPRVALVVMALVAVVVVEVVMLVAVAVHVAPTGWDPEVLGPYNPAVMIDLL